MIRINTKLIIILAALCSQACRHNDTATSETLNATQPNTDIQVVKVESRGTIMFSNIASPGTASYFDCNYKDTTIINGAQGARATCTSAVAQAKGFPMVNNYVEPEATYRGNPGNAASFRHWCHGSEVTVAVKKAAYESANFQGVGFYGRDNIINNANDQQRIFHPKNSLKLAGSEELKNEGNQEVVLMKFFAAGPCEINGTGRNPSGFMEFKPYVSYDGFIERWENVSDNHKISYGKSWDRSGDLF
jgi:hypothetical protein